MFKKTLMYFLSITLLSIMLGCTSGGGGGSSSPEVVTEVVTNPPAVVVDPVVVNSSTSFSINTSSVSDNLSRGTASSTSEFGDNYKLVVLRGSADITADYSDSINTTNENGVINIEFSKVTTDGVLTSGSDGLLVGDIITLEVSGYAPQQFVVTQSMLDLNANALVLKQIDSRQTFTLENLTSGSDRVSARSSMGAKVYSTDTEVVFETLNKSVQLSFDTEGFNRLTQSIARLPQADGNTLVTMDMTTVDPNLEDDAAIGDFSYKPTAADNRDISRATMADNDEDTGLESVVMANVEMRTSNGDTIDCFGGGNFDEATQTCDDDKIATLKMKVPASQFERYAKSYNNGSLIVPLYSYSKSEATWIRQTDSSGEPIDGELVLEDNDANQLANEGDTLFIVGTVGHFSYWNGDYPIQNTCLKGTIVPGANGIPYGTLIKTQGIDYSGRKTSQRLSDETTAFDKLNARRSSQVDVFIEYSDGSTSSHKTVSTTESPVTDECQDVGEFTVDDGTLITITVEDQTGAKLNRARVRAAGSSKYTDENGTAEFTIYGSGTSVTAYYYLDGNSFSAQKDVNETATVVIDTSLTELKGSVSVKENGVSSPAVGAYVYVRATDYSYSRSASVNDDGTYSVNLPKTKVADHTEVNIRVSYYYREYAKYLYANVDKTLDANSINNIDAIELTIKPVTITGRVTQRFATDDKIGISGAYVYLGRRSVYADSEGYYAATIFDEGDDNITAYAYDYSSYKSSEKKYLNPIDGNQSIDFQIDNRPSYITGKVINTKGVGIENARVYWTGDWRSVRSDENGSFTIKTYTMEENNRNYVVRAYLDGKYKDYDANLSTIGTTVDAGYLTFDFNIAPVIKDVVLDPSDPVAGKEFLVQIDAYDIDGDELTYTLENRYSGYHEVTISDTSDSGVYNVTANSAGSIYLLVTVSDGVKETTKYLSRYIKRNSVPYISSVSGVVSDYDKSSDMNVTVSAYDNDGDSLTYLFELLDLNGKNHNDKLTQNDNSVLISKSIANASYKLKVSVSDGVNQREAKKSFTADNNIKPVILDIYANTVPTKSKAFYAKTTDTISLEANASDANGDALTYSWSIAGKTSTDKTFALGTVGIGTYTGYLQVSDTAGLYDTAKFSLVIAANQKPTFSSLTWEPTIIVKDSNGIYTNGDDENISDVTLTVVAADEENDTLEYTFGNIDGDTIVGTASANSATYPLNTLKAGKHAVKVTLTDGTNTVVRYTSFEIKQNNPPVIKAFYVPYTAKSASVINVNAFAVDNEGDTLTYKWSTTSGTLSGETTSNAKVALPTVTLDTNVTVTLDVTAGKDTVRRTRVVTVRPNQPPTIKTKRFYSTSVIEGDKVNFEATAYDIDGSVKSYEWLVDGTVVTTGTISSFTANTVGVYTVSLRITDDSNAQTVEEFTKDKLTVSAKNAAPIINSLVATSVNLLPGEDTNLSVSASDADGDLISTVWSSTGGTLTSNNDKASFSATEVGTYTITAKVTDGTHTPVQKSIEVTVESVTFNLSASKTSVITGTEVTLNSSFSDSTIVSSATTWSISSKPAGSTVSVVGDGSSGKISPDVAGTYTLKAQTSLYGITYSKEISISASTEIVGNVIEGVIEGANGDILVGAQIRLYNKADSAIYDVMLTSDADGGYKFTDIPAGDYYLVVYAGQDYIQTTQVVTVN
ncbi:hypothetical protein GJV85_01880 [Sulfurimonas aquatica]|uniref:PKD/Chitinase domain-containing protein n=1 Tax=Sulfurimonas aquatica TaxID=2672570 RepID=A0A975GBP7_9BACT|nr:carboxypeptidase-like regulatory domain-containing protein [Sulfurimonas aquatica]QSZ40911.1 hypothetical protein GJV85_01880 [Sulfurimonas aquatica]